jgi:hypothetical protein
MVGSKAERGGIAKDGGCKYVVQALRLINLQARRWSGLWLVQTFRSLLSLLVAVLELGIMAWPAEQ